jgi:PAS domain-containing protein
MTDIPDEYISITSGLGDANPRALLISPLKVNEEIFGVVELASFKPFELYQLEFVQKVSESIAATISSVTVNIRTNLLLEQTKLQAEEMANQEEELRQNMEEMQTTQEESRRREEELRDMLSRMEEAQAVGAEKEHEMQQFHKMIFGTFNMVEFSADGVITDVNQNLINVFGNITKAEFIGKPLAGLIGEENFKTAWAKIARGETYEDVQTVTASTGVTACVRQKFMPILDRNGKLLKVMMAGMPEDN